MSKWLYSIPGFSDYHITRSAKVYSIKHGHLKKLKLAKVDRYYYVALVDDEGIRKANGVHCLMLITFVGPRPKGMHSCHRDGNGRNNKLSNLRWDTPSGNYFDNYRNGTARLGPNHANSKLNETQVRIIRKCSHLPLTFLSSIFNVTATTLCQIRRNRIWRHIELNEHDRLSRTAWNGKINFAQFRIIRSCVDLPAKFLSDCLNVSFDMCYKIKEGICKYEKHGWDKETING